VFDANERGHRMNICVGNLSSDVTGSDLREVFESFGRVETADVVKDRHGNASRGFGYVGMSARSEAVCAVLGVHGRRLNGQTITATEVRPRDPVSGACHTRCHCRSGRQPTGETHPIPAAFRSEERSDGTGKNGLE
jgi:RNA recognition motif-containing protein